MIFKNHGVIHIKKDVKYMKYYKIIKDNDTFIGVITESDFRKYQRKHNILLVCNSKNAEYARYNDILYRDRSWMNPVNIHSNLEFISVDIVNITEDDYNSLVNMMNLNEEIKIISDEEPIIEDEIIENKPEKEVTIDFVRQVKITEMTNICKKTIIDGFNTSLSDGNFYHFSLTIEDQINLLNISNNIDNSDDKIIYHADGERCKYFSKDDMKLIITKANNFKMYHTTYFNCLKSYINSLSDINTISNITYGIQLPEKFTHVFLTTYKA